MKALNEQLSLNFTCVLIFVTHTLVNAVLLSAWNPLRCNFYKDSYLSTCEDSQKSSIFDWFAQSQAHLGILLACLAYSAKGIPTLEQLLVGCCLAVILCHLSTGIFLLDIVDTAMATTQTAIYCGMLACLVGLLNSDTSSSSNGSNARRKNSVDRSAVSSWRTTTAVGVNFALYTAGVLQKTPWRLPEQSDEAIFLNLARATSVNHMLIAFLLLVSIGSIQLQQKVILCGHAAALLGTLLLYQQGPQQARVVDFLAALLASVAAVPKFAVPSS
jgi:hypothetical protein